MECVPESITPKEEKKLKLVDAMEYKLDADKDIFQVKVGKNEKKNKIIIHISKINELVDIFYENEFTFDDLLKLDKTFRICDELDEIFKNIITFFNEKKVIIKEVKDDSLILNLKLSSMTGKEKNVEMKLFKKEMNQDSIVKELCKKIKILEEENKNLKEEIKIFKKELNDLNNIRNDLNELKKWKNEKEDEFKKLIKEKKNVSILQNIDSKILTKAEDFEFIENAYKNNDKLLMNKIFKPKLLYRVTRDGDSATVFHNKCDNIKGTLTLVKTKKGFIFGGYTNETWNSGGYKKDDNAFCFSIDLKKIYKSKKTNNCIYCDSGYGPVFGDYIFCIYNNCLSKGGMMNDGLNNNYDGQQKANEINNGEQYFGVIEVEVFEIILE